MSSAARPESFPVCPVSQLTPRLVTWLWLAWLAPGKLAILDGDPGLGKSLLTLDLCARLSTGRPFPDGSPGPGPGNALVLNGEDGAEDTVRPRLQALGADLDRVFVLPREGRAGVDLLRLPEHAELLGQAIARVSARLLVIDPIMAFLDRSILSGSDQSVRRALLPLADLAEQHGWAALLVRHLNKSPGRQAIYRGAGSIGFLAACRCGWLVARDPHNPDRRVLAQVKNNLAPLQPSLTYTVHSQDLAAPTLSWLDPCPSTADELLAGARRPAPASPRDRARDFLASFLQDGPQTSRAIWDSAREQGLAERTLNRAKRELDIRSLRVCEDGKPISYWLLPGQQLPAPSDPEADLEAWLAPLRAQFPPSTPLDDL
jgi:hypothetical protein